MNNPNLRECGWCGHAWGEHRLDDRTSPIRWPCQLCHCPTFDHRGVGNHEEGELMECLLAAVILSCLLYFAYRVSP